VIATPRERALLGGQLGAKNRASERHVVNLSQSSNEQLPAAIISGGHPRSTR